MSRHYSNRYPNYGGDYDADYDDPRDHRSNSKSRYHLPDSRDTSRYKTDADCDDPRDHHSNQHSKYIDVNDPWHIDPRDLNKWVPTDPRNHLSRNSDVTYPYEGISRTELRQNLGKNSGRRAAKPTRRETRVSDDDFVPQSRHERSQHEPAPTRRRRTDVPTARASKHWSDDENKEMVRLVKEGFDYYDIAERMHRTVNSCRIHWSELRHLPVAEGVRYDPWVD